MIKPDLAKIMRSHFYAPSIRLQTQCNNQSNYHWVTAITPIKTQRRKSFADFFQYFFLLTYIFDAINPLLANDHLCPGGFHLIATYC